MSIKATPDFCRSWFVLNNSYYPGLDPSSFSCQILLWAGLLGIPTSEILSIWKIQWPESLCWPLEGALSSHIRVMALCWAAHHFLMLSWIKIYQLHTLNSLGNAQCQVPSDHTLMKSHIVNGWKIGRKGSSNGFQMTWWIYPRRWPLVKGPSLFQTIYKLNPAWQRS